MNLGTIQPLRGRSANGEWVTYCEIIVFINESRCDRTGTIMIWDDVWEAMKSFDTKYGDIKWTWQDSHGEIELDTDANLILWKLSKF
jgi:hypothetical protein